MVKTHYALSAILLTATTLTAFAQTRPAPFDLTSTLTQLETDANPQHSAALLAALPPSALPKIYQALDSTSLSPRVRSALESTLPDLTTRFRDAYNAQLKATENAWMTETGPNAYKTIGQHNPSWDSLVLDAYTRDASTPPRESALRFKAAIDAGCNDPLVRYYYIRRAFAAAFLTPSATSTLYASLVIDMDKSSYSILRKIHCHTQLLQRLLAPDASPADRAAAIDNFRTTTDLLHKVTKNDFNPLSFMDDIGVVIWAGRLLGHTETELHDLTHPLLTRLLPDDYYTFANEAEYCITWAWEARGGGYAPSVSDAAWKTFHERIALAETAATQGFYLNPSHGSCPASMIVVCMANSDDRAIMEKWFSRAMLANPDNYQACLAKLTFLAPKWGGTDLDLLVFGRECLKTGSVKSRIPTILLEAHNAIAESLDDKESYFSQPMVWSDIKQVYTKLLADKTRFQNDRHSYLFDRAKFVRHACDSKKWAEALDLMNQYGNNIDLEAFGGQAMYNFYKKKATTELAKTPA